MQLSPDERKRSYDEEKARIEEDEAEGIFSGGSTTGLKPNVAGLLCYLGAWVTGIIFIIIEQKNRFVRFHALQSIVTFGGITVAGSILKWIPVFGGLFSVVIGLLAFFLWILMMVKAYHGEWYKIPVAGDIAESILPAAMNEGKAATAREPVRPEPKRPEKPAEVPAPPGVAAAVAGKAQEFERRADKFGEKVDSYFTGTRAGRVAGYTALIFWNAVLLVFFSGFYQYIAWYHIEADGGVTRLPMLVSGDYLIWLPILITAIVITIAAYILLIIYDKYWLRETVQIILAVIGMIVVANLISIFPFNFNVIPNNTAIDILPAVVRIVLVFIAVGMGVGALVRFVKLIVTAAGHIAD